MWPAMVWWFWWSAVLELPGRDKTTQVDQKRS